MPTPVQHKRMLIRQQRETVFKTIPKLLLTRLFDTRKLIQNFTSELHKAFGTNTNKIKIIKNGSVHKMIIICNSIKSLNIAKNISQGPRQNISNVNSNGKNLIPLVETKFPKPLNLLSRVL